MVGVCFPITYLPVPVCFPNCVMVGSVEVMSPFSDGGSKIRPSEHGFLA